MYPNIFINNCAKDISCNTNLNNSCKNGLNNINNEEEQQKLMEERSNALAILNMLSDGTSSDNDNNNHMQNNNKNRMLPLGQYASINSCERYNPLLEDAYKLEIGGLPPTKDTNKAERDVATATSENNKEEKPDAIENKNNETNDEQVSQERSFWTSKTNYWTSMFNDAAEKNKQGANTNTSASSNFNVSSLFSFGNDDSNDGDNNLNASSSTANINNDPDGGIYNDSGKNNNFTMGFKIQSSIDIERKNNKEYVQKIMGLIKPFRRGQTMDEITEEWKETRRDLTLAFKRKYKVAMKIARNKK